MTQKTKKRQRGKLRNMRRKLRQNCHYNTDIKKETDEDEEEVKEDSDGEGRKGEKPGTWKMKKMKE